MYTTTPAQHMSAAIDAGADAVLAASIFHDGHTTVGDIKDDLARAGIAVRRELGAKTAGLQENAS